MRAVCLLWLATTGLLIAQREPAATPPRVAVVEFDPHGFPIVADEALPVRRAPVQPPAAPLLDASIGSGPVREVAAGPALASGMERNSPLLAVYQSVQPPGVFRRLQGVTVVWRVSIHDEQGAVLGQRDVTHTADLSHPARDRLEFVADGRRYGRQGNTVFAERQGRPWPTWNELASQDLELFGMQLRQPWCFGDSNQFVVVGDGIELRNGERLQRIRLERRLPAAVDAIGPEANPQPRDRFELWCDPASGRPLEFTQHFAWPGSGQRRVLLQQWEEFQGVLIPRRRVYVDDKLRPTTVLQIQSIQQVAVQERDFRLL